MTTPVLEYAVAFTPRSAIWVKLTPSVDRSTLNPCSVAALSVQVRSIRLDEIGVAARLLGAAGPEVVVAEAVFDQAVQSFAPS